MRLRPANIKDGGCLRHQSQVVTVARLCAVVNDGPHKSTFLLGFLKTVNGPCASRSEYDGTDEGKQIRKDILENDQSIPVTHEDRIQRHQSANGASAEAQSKLPPNYITCLQFINNVVKPMPAVSSIFGIPPYRHTPKLTKREADIENPERRTQEGDPSPNGDQGHRLLPPNYITCFSFVELVSKTLLIIFGSEMTSKLREMKKRHKRSVMIMKVLLLYASTLSQGKSLFLAN
ncbi:ANK REP REGION domain-containing protein [Fagus crenata]